MMNPEESQPSSASLDQTLHSWQKFAAALKSISPAGYQLIPDRVEIQRALDRPLRAFVGVQFLLALVTGIAVYLSLTLLEMIGWPTIQYKVPLAVWAAV